MLVGAKWRYLSLYLEVHDQWYKAQNSPFDNSFSFSNSFFFISTLHRKCWPYMVFLSIPFNKWLIQGSISTVLAVLPLFLIRSYILHTFTKMVLLVIGLGALHGLVIIPAIMALLDNLGCQITKQWRLFKDWKDWLWRLKKRRPNDIL